MKNSAKFNLTRFANSFRWCLNLNKNPNDLSNQEESGMKTELDKLPSIAYNDIKIEFYANSSTPKKLVFIINCVSPDEFGNFDGWNYFEVIVTPTFGWFNFKIIGKDTDKNKPAIHQLFAETFEI